MFLMIAGVGALFAAQHWVPMRPVFCAQLKLVQVRGYEHPVNSSWWRRMLRRPRPVYTKEVLRAVEVVLQDQCR